MKSMIPVADWIPPEDTGSGFVYRAKPIPKPVVEIKPAKKATGHYWIVSAKSKTVGLHNIYWLMVEGKTSSVTSNKDIATKFKTEAEAKHAATHNNFSGWIFVVDEIGKPAEEEVDDAVGYWIVKAKTISSHTLYLNRISKQYNLSDKEIAQKYGSYSAAMNDVDVAKNRCPGYMFEAVLVDSKSSKKKQPADEACWIITGVMKSAPDSQTLYLSQESDTGRCMNSLNQAERYTTYPKAMKVYEEAVKLWKGFKLDVVFINGSKSLNRKAFLREAARIPTKEAADKIGWIVKVETTIPGKFNDERRIGYITTEVRQPIGTLDATRKEAFIFPSRIEAEKAWKALWGGAVSVNWSAEYIWAEDKKKDNHISTDSYWVIGGKNKNDKKNAPYIYLVTPGLNMLDRAIRYASRDEATQALDNLKTIGVKGFNLARWEPGVIEIRNGQRVKPKQDNTSGYVIEMFDKSDNSSRYLDATQNRNTMKKAHIYETKAEAEEAVIEVKPAYSAYELIVRQVSRVAK